MNRAAIHFTFVSLALLTLELSCEGHRLDAQSVHPTLQLRDSVRMQLLATLDVTGAAIGQSGSLVYWSAPERRVYVVGQGSIQQVCQQFQPMVVAAAAVDSQVEIVDALNRQMLRLGANGSCSVTAKLAMNQISAAVRTRDHWVLVGIDSESQAGWFRIDSSKQAVPVLVKIRSRSDLLRSQYSAGGDVVVATQIHWPFRWTKDAADGAQAIVAQPFDVDTLISYESEGVPVSRLLALPTIELDSGYLEQLADATSDLRVFILFDRAGTRTRITLIDKPIGFLASDPDRHALLGLLTSNVRELIVYSWHWLFPENN